MDDSEQLGRLAERLDIIDNIVANQVHQQLEGFSSRMGIAEDTANGKALSRMLLAVGGTIAAFTAYRLFRNESGKNTSAKANITTRAKVTPRSAPVPAVVPASSTLASTRAPAPASAPAPAPRAPVFLLHPRALLPL